jgi:hypothetical protein
MVALEPGKEKPMRKFTWLVLPIVVALVGTVSAQDPLQECTAILADALGPTGGTFAVGDVVEFTMSISVPASPNPPTYCTLVDVDVYFFPPPTGAQPYGGGCDGIASGILIASGLTLVPGGAAYTFTSADNPALSYVVQPGDAGGVIRADMATTFFIQGAPGDMQCDEKVANNNVECPVPCVDIYKDVDCEYSKVGDEVIYEVCIYNCGEFFDLTDIVVTDTKLGDISSYFPATLAPLDDFCAYIPYIVQPGDDFGPGTIIENQATVTAIDDCDGETEVTATSDIIEVMLLHPEFTVTKECVEPALVGDDVFFDIEITNIGDVALNFTTDEAGVGPFSLDPLQVYSTTINGGPCELPGVENTIEVTATIPPEYCELPNTIIHSASDECPCLCTPCIEIDKEVDCEYSKVGDEVIYTICVHNCGDIELTGVVVTDTKLGDISSYFPSVLAVDELACADIPYIVQPEDDFGPGTIIENQATAEGTGACGDVIETVTDVSDIIEVMLIHPEFTVTKVCVDDPLDQGATDAAYTITIDNTGDVDLVITTDDPAIPGPFTLAWDGAAFEQVVTVPVPPGATEVCNEVEVTATIPPEYCELPNVVIHSASDCCAVPGDEGCTPGYWKNHPDCWECFDPETPLCDVFTVPAELQEEFCDDDLMDAMNYGGGPGVEGAARNLFRHATAALQNACDADVAYPLTVAGVIDLVNDALATGDRGEIDAAKNILAGYNEAGCPQDAHCRPIPDGEEPDMTPDQRSIEPSVTPEERSEVLPEKLSVSGFPNPASAVATIRLAIPVESRVTVEILDVQGRSVATLLDEHMSAGSHSVMWNGEGAPAGVYFCKVRCCDGKETISKVIKIQ